MSNKIYTTIPAPKVPRNTFNRSRPNSLTMPFQRNVPTMVEEIYPGDLMRCNPELFARLQPMIAPVMNNMKISTHFFYVPLRTLNKHFSEFMFNNRTGDYSEVLPYCYTGTLWKLVNALHSSYEDDVAAEVIRLLDFIGLPFRYSSKTSASAFVSNWLADDWNAHVAGGVLAPAGGEPDVSTGSRINLAPFFAYQKIWSEYFRDENVEEDVFVDFETKTSQDVFEWTGDVSATLGSLMTSLSVTLDAVASLFMLRRRAWAHDRFTSSLPFAQRGPDVLLPISGTAPVVYKEGSLTDYGPTPDPGNDPGGLLVYPIATQSAPPSTEQKFPLVKGTTNNSLYVSGYGTGSIPGNTPTAYDPNGTLETDFTAAGLTTTINDFRIAELRAATEKCVPTRWPKGDRGHPGGGGRVYRAGQAGGQVP